MLPTSFSCEHREMMMTVHFGSTFFIVVVCYGIKIGVFGRLVVNFSEKQGFDDGKFVKGDKKSEYPLARVLRLGIHRCDLVSYEF